MIFVKKSQIELFSLFTLSRNGKDAKERAVFLLMDGVRRCAPRDTATVVRSVNTSGGKHSRRSTALGETRLEPEPLGYQIR